MLGDMFRLQMAWAGRLTIVEKIVCVCYFGDGAMHQGAFFEALYLAQLYKLPCIFICENNFYAMGTSLDRQSLSLIYVEEQMGSAWSMSSLKDLMSRSCAIGLLQLVPAQAKVQFFKIITYATGDTRCPTQQNTVPRASWKRRTI